MKIAIIGGCQVVGLGAVSQRFVPEAEVKTWHVGHYPPDAPDVLLEKLADFDLVVSQVVKGEGEANRPLFMDNLLANGIKAHYLPPFVFWGFHPDCVYLVHDNSIVPAPHTDFHSRIAVAAFLLGYDVKKTQTLYNAFICSELGYFDAFPAARLATEMNLAKHGYEPAGLIDQWLSEIGAFMYMPNHPHIDILSTLLRQLYVRIGLIAADTPLPKDVPDNLGESFCWPVYPALAKRAGVTGSMTFRKGLWLGPSRDVAFSDYMSCCFELYAATERERLETPQVLETRAKLEAMLG